ncbi:YraN family protein [Inmirania thermothiophila]|uniref:UPF0102 protein EDC57_2342 n=1 Tax=Inmirania thermothiophila TaxID=1750597 RepID=A0A3N1XU20_9GAMM|nr:YraN family protein [Inmirania thermothiophila]ROR29671.1 putative endonuclease [Inmirania thermothiophila]
MRGGDAAGRGRMGEEAALAHLRGHGLRLIARNHRCRAGEIDLVMAEGEVVVFVEVRLRRRSDYGSALESVDARKQRRIAEAARHFLAGHPELARRPARFDVVAVEPSAGGLACRWIRDAFRC